jgi:hypothetical protein
MTPCVRYGENSTISPGKRTIDEHHLSLDMRDAATFVVQRFDACYRHVTTLHGLRERDFTRSQARPRRVHRTIIRAMDKTLLGGLSPRTFLRDYWQKKPLLIRAAVPGFNGLLSRDDLMGLAQ